MEQQQYLHLFLLTLHLSIMTDDVVDGKCSEEDFRGVCCSYGWK